MCIGDTALDIISWSAEQQRAENEEEKIEAWKNAPSEKKLKELLNKGKIKPLRV